MRKQRYRVREIQWEPGGLTYKILCRNHPKFDLTIISRICVHLIHRMNVRTENVHTRLSDVKSMNR